jgi:hypothetical protein
MIINELCKNCVGYTQPNGCVGEVEFITMNGIIVEPKVEYCAYFRTVEDEFCDLLDDNGLADYVNACEDYGFPVEDCPF